MCSGTSGYCFGCGAEGDDELPADLVEAGCYATTREASDHGLVVLALGRPYWLVPSTAGHRLLVEADVAGFVGDQLRRFDRESFDWPALVERVDASYARARGA